MVTGVRGTVLQPTTASRGEATSREAVGDFEFRAGAVVMTSGGIGGNSDIVREAWPKRLGNPPKHMIAGVPEHVDGSGIQLTQRAGGRVINPDRMWHYVEGVKNHSPIWKNHGIRILPGPSSLWLDATGKRLPAPLFPGFDTLGSLEYLRKTGHDHSWFILNARIIEKEFALSGSEQNPDLTGRSVKEVLGRVRPGPTAPVQAFIDRGEDFVQATTLEELVSRMNALEPQGPLLDIGHISAVVHARDRDVVNTFGKDAQIAAIRSARGFLGDKLMRSVAPHQLLDPKAGPLIAVRLHVITRKTLGGLETDLAGRVLAEGGAPIPGLFAAGEASGFGGGGMHGYRSLEGTFLDGCLFSGRAAGRAAAAAVG
ncbi:putative oxidoreductase [Arthrobacter roseus]|nr:putative oxidoreductase [Arthrobacter roseus]